MQKPEPEFDSYSSEYKNLLDDPIRQVFAADGVTFFHQRKRDLIRAFFRRLGRDTHTMSWLDFGCGQGDLLEMMHTDFARSAGCDPSTGMIQQGSGFEVVHQPDMGKIPFPDASFDFVSSVCVYHHVPVAARKALTREVARVIKPGGYFAIIEHNPWNPLTNLIVKRSPVDVDAILLAPAETRSLLASAGFDLKPTDFFLYLPVSLYRAPLTYLETLFRRVPLGGQYSVFGRREDSTPAQR